MRVVFTLLLSLALGAPQVRRQPDIHFVPTPPEIVDAMLDLAGVTANDVVYDLGSGDGRIVIAAARRFGARGVGIELDPRLVAEARQIAQGVGVANRVTFIEADIFDTNISGATVVTLYLLTSVNERLRPKLTRELRPGARIVSHQFGMGDWKPDRELVLDGRPLFLWRIPDR